MGSFAVQNTVDTRPERTLLSTFRTFDRRRSGAGPPKVCTQADFALFGLGETVPLFADESA